jgi:hypothetical protein
MIKNIVLMAITLLICLISCQRKSPDSALVEGKLTEASGMKLTLQEMDVKDIRSADSVILDQSGNFSFNVTVKEAGFWLIKAPSGKILVLLLNTGERILLSGSASDFPDNLRLEGGGDARLLYDFFTGTRKNEKMADSLEMLLVERQDSSGYYELTQRLDTLFKQIWDKQLNYEKDFIGKYPGSLASLVVLNYAFGMSPVLSPAEDFHYYHVVDSALWMKYPTNKHVKFHHQRVAEMRRTLSHN